MSAQIERKMVADGFMALPSGVNSGRARSLLTPGHVSMAVNCRFRGDYITHRPGWRRLALDYSTANGQVDVETNFKTKRWQGAAFYQSITDAAHLVAAIGGRLFRIRVALATPMVEDITISGNPNDSTLDQCWFAQTPGYLVVQDNQSRAIIYNGNACRRSSAEQSEVPTGNVMAYGSGRLWVTLTDRRSFIASNLIYDPASGTSQTRFRDSVLRFTDNERITGGGSFGVPVEGGPISAMAFTGNMDTSTGQGPLQVFTTNTVFTVDAPFDRELWAYMLNPIQTVGLPSGGAMGNNGVCVVNGDIWYRDKVGVRSFMVARREYGTWSNTPLSRGISYVMDYDDRRLLWPCSCTEFDNRMLMTVAPQRVEDHGVVHLGLVSLDFAPVSDTDDFGAISKRPVWDGLWTGLHILQVLAGEVNGERRCFLFTLNASDEIELWELTLSDRRDNNTRSIEWWFVTPEYRFGDATAPKELVKGRAWVDDIDSTAALSFSYAPDNYPAWTAWTTLSLCASTDICNNDLCTLTLSKPQVRASVDLIEPPDACRTGQDTLMRIGNTFTFKIAVTGSCTLSRFRVDAQRLSDTTVGECPTAESCQYLTGCGDDLFSYTSV